jgi:hypothetical protein
MKIFGRDPVLWLGLVAAIVQFVSAFLTPISVETQGLIAAFSLAIVGVIQAIVVRDGSAVPAVTGLFKAGIALGLAFGLKWSPEQQAEVMFMVQAVLGLLVRPQVTAPIDARGQVVPKVTNLRAG